MAKKNFFNSFEKNLSFNHSEKAETAVLDKQTSKGNQQSEVADTAPVAKIPKTSSVPKKEDKTSPTKVTTFRIEVDLLQKIKAIAYWERQKIQDVVDEALTGYVNNYSDNELSKALKAYRKVEG